MIAVGRVAFLSSFFTSDQTINLIAGPVAVTGVASSISAGGTAVALTPATITITGPGIVVTPAGVTTMLTPGAIIITGGALSIAAVAAAPTFSWPLGTSDYPAGRSTTMPSFSIKQGDLLPVLTATLMQGVGTADAAAVDLTDATSIRFLMRPYSGAPVIDGPAEFVSKPAGTVKYQWQAGDTDDVGTYRVEWEVTFAAGTMTFPSGGYDLVRVVDDIA